MASLKDCLGEGLFAGLASRLRTEEDVYRAMQKIVKSVLHGREASEDCIMQIQDFYARKFYEHSKFFEAREALTKLFYNIQKVSPDEVLQK